MKSQLTHTDEQTHISDFIQIKIHIFIIIIIIIIIIYFDLTILFIINLAFTIHSISIFIQFNENIIRHLYP